MDMLRQCLLAAFLLLPLSSIAQADTLLIDSAAQALSAGIALPTRGMTMQQIEQKFGAPREKVAPVGDPPISRWVYPEYTVYFEHQYVLHTVLHRDGETAQ